MITMETGFLILLVLIFSSFQIVTEKLTRKHTGCGFKSSCSHLNFRFRACFEQVVPWYSGKYRERIHSERRTWHDKNKQLEKLRLIEFYPFYIFELKMVKMLVFTVYHKWAVNKLHLNHNNFNCPFDYFRLLDRGYKDDKA